jgi:hypothetical protein
VASSGTGPASEAAASEEAASGEAAAIDSRLELMRDFVLIPVVFYCSMHFSIYASV